MRSLDRAAATGLLAVTGEEVDVRLVRGEGVGELALMLLVLLAELFNDDGGCAPPG